MKFWVLKLTDLHTFRVVMCLNSSSGASDKHYFQLLSCCWFPLWELTADLCQLSQHACRNNYYRCNLRSDDRTALITANLFTNELLTTVYETIFIMFPAWHSNHRLWYKRRCFILMFSFRIVFWVSTKMGFHALMLRNTSFISYSSSILPLSLWGPSPSWTTSPLWLVDSHMPGEFFQISCFLHLFWSFRLSVAV